MMTIENNHHGFLYVDELRLKTPVIPVFTRMTVLGLLGLRM